MTDFDALGARELDALVAERIMGWTLDRTRTSDDGAPVVLNELPRFAATPPAARGAALILEQRHLGISVRHDAREPRHRFVVRGPSGREYAAEDGSEAVAMCRAMLAAIDGEGPGLPNEQLRPRRDARAAATAAELLAARAQPHQSVGLMAHALVLQNGEHKEGAARALLEHAMAQPEIVPILAEQAAAGEREVALACVAALDFLAKAGAAARAALPAAAGHPDPDVAAAARDASRDS